MQLKSRTQLTTQASPINHIKFQPQTDYAIIAQESTLQLFNVKNRNLIFSYQSHYEFNNSTINSFDFLKSSNFSNSNNGNTANSSDMKIVSVSKSIQIHDIMTSTPIRWFNNYDGNKFKINDIVCLSPDIISICDENCLVKLYDLRQVSNYKPIQEFQDSKDCLNCIDYDSKTNKLFVGSNDGGLYCYDLRKGLLLRDELDAPITSIQVKPSKSQILLSLLNDEVKLFDYDQNNTVSKLKKKTNDKEFKIDSKFFGSMGFISGSETGDLYYKSLQEKETSTSSTSTNGIDSIKLYDIDLKHNAVISSLDVDGERVLIGNGNGRFELLEGLTPN